MAWKYQRRKCENNKNGASSQKTKTAKTAKTAKHENHENRENCENREKRKPRNTQKTRKLREHWKPRKRENRENAKTAKTRKPRKPREQENAEETSTIGRISRFSPFLGFLVFSVFWFSRFSGFLVFSFPCISPFWPRRVDFLLSRIPCVPPELPVQVTIDRNILTVVFPEHAMKHSRPVVWMEVETQMTGWSVVLLVCWNDWNGLNDFYGTFERKYHISHLESFMNTFDQLGLLSVIFLPGQLDFPLDEPARYPCQGWLLEVSRKVWLWVPGKSFCFRDMHLDMCNLTYLRVCLSVRAKLARNNHEFYI